MAATLGGLGIWYLYDLILVASGSFRDAEGRLVRRWDPENALPGGHHPAEVLDELDRSASQVSELAERVDFAERLLASPRPARTRPPVPLLTMTARPLPSAGSSPGPAICAPCSAWPCPWCQCRWG